MKKVGLSLLALMFMFSVVLTKPVFGDTTPSCYNFNYSLYYGQEQSYKYLLEWAQTYKRNDKIDEYSATIAKIRSNVSMLHIFLEKEGYNIAADEKSSKTYGASTAAAVSAYQEKNSSKILTPKSLTAGIGIFTSGTADVLNQKYGCIGKAVISLSEPNGTIVKAIGENMSIKWNASNIPNEATLNISYAKQNGTGTTTIIEKTIKNGKGAYDWKIPTLASGSYKILLQLVGTTKSDISANAFEIREKALEITSPTSLQDVTPGQKLTVTWKASSVLKPQDKLRLSISGTLVASGSETINLEIAKVSNTGSYVWTVPDRLNGKYITGASTFKLSLESEDGAYKAVTSDVVKISPSSQPQVTMTVTSPSTKDFLVGQKLPIRWTSKGLTGSDEVEIALNINGGDKAGDYRIQRMKNTGSFDWTIPDMLRSDISLATTTQSLYSISIVPTAKSTVRGTSDNFSVIPVASPTIKIISPNGGEAKTGKSFVVTWESGNLASKVKTMSLELIQTDIDAISVAIMKSGLSASATSYTFTLPTSGTLGNIRGIGTVSRMKYKVRIKAFDSSGKIVVMDQSDGDFTITK